MTETLSQDLFNIFYIYALYIYIVSTTNWDKSHEWRGGGGSFKTYEFYEFENSRWSSQSVNVKCYSAHFNLKTQNKLIDQFINKLIDQFINKYVFIKGGSRTLRYLNGILCYYIKVKLLKSMKTQKIVYS